VIVEPLVQCAGGMRMYDPVYLQLLRKACDRYQVHLIADEVASASDAPELSSPASRLRSAGSSVFVQGLTGGICRSP